MQNNDWRNSLNTFLEPWLKKPEVVGALVTGSYVVGTNTPQSDIDVHVFLADGTDWKERGNTMVDGHLIEYFALPVHLYRQLFDMDHSDNQRTNARMMSVGEIIVDKTGVVATLKALGDEYMSKPFPKISALQVEDRKYWLWDSMDGLEDLFSSQAPNKGLVYSSHLTLVLNVYTVYLGQEMPHLSKVHKLFTSSEFRTRYHFSEFPDAAFTEKFLNALNAPQEQQLTVAHDLTNYVLNAMGGFTIDGWRLHSRGDSIDV